ncbi:putative atrial natriuretic peptide receptor, partial [Operophtera brumata]
MTQMRDLGVKCAGAHNTRDKTGLGGTFARTLPPAYKVSKSVVALLKAFGWSKFAVVAGDDHTAAQQQMDAIKVNNNSKYSNQQELSSN